MTGQDLPMSVEAERYVIGAALVDPAAVHRVADWLAEDDFALCTHRAIWRTITTLVAGDKPADAVTIGEQLDGGPDGVSFGDLIDIAQNQTSSANVVAWAEIVLEKSRLRKLIDVGTRLAGAATKQGAGSGELAAHALNLISQLSAENRGGLKPIKPAANQFFNELAERYESGNKMHGRGTPWQKLNELTRGLRGGELVVLAGRPGMGKSVMGFGMATFDALSKGGRTAVFSLEMTAVEFIQREISALGDVSHDWLRAPTKDGPDSDIAWGKVSTGMQSLLRANLVIDDTPGITVAQIAARARRAHLQSPLSMVVVDHMHIVRIKGDNPVRELGDISRALKALAKELNIPVVALAQLNRGNTHRTDKRPTMADLRGSGEIEQDADYIFLLHREDYYAPDNEPTNVLEVIVGKSRNAASDTVQLRAKFGVMRIEDRDGPDMETRPRAMAPVGMPEPRRWRAK